MDDEASVNEIGYLARIIDKDMRILERMKIKKSTIKRIFGALLIYIGTIIILSIIL